MMVYRIVSMAMAAGLAVASPAYAQSASQSDKPIEVSSDKLDVLQSENKAVFTGNVIAVQGTSNLRAAQMTVFYRPSSAAAAPAAAGAASPPPGITRIEAAGQVVFTTPTEVALGDNAVYNVDTNTIDLMGKDVTLTRGANILKGTKLNHNMTTGRSILTAGSGATSDISGTKPARVHGLFMPKSDPKPAGTP